MKILKEKHESDYFPIIAECQKVTDNYGFSYDSDYCHSELEIDREDLVKRTWQKYPDYEGTDYGVVCPVCGNFVVVDVSNLPRKILHEVKDYNKIQKEEN